MTDPLRPGVVSPGQQPVRPTAPDGMRASALEVAGDRLERTPLPEPPPKSPLRPARDVAPWVQQRIEASVGALFVQRRGGPGDVRAVVAAAWEPGSLTPYSNGALPAAPGGPLPEAPAPGAGRVSPPGMRQGNTLLRYGASGELVNFTLLDQGQTNGCGTTGLAMVLNYFEGGKPAYTREALDSAIRHHDMFTSPGEMARFAEERGLVASIHSGTQPAELRRLLDAGLPVQILMDVSEQGNGSGLHYEVVTGHGVGPDGERYFELANPWGRREYMAEAVLLEKWGSLKAAGVPIGLDRVAVVLKPRGNPTPLPPDQRGAFLNASTVALRVAQGVTQISTGWARREPHRLVAGLLRTVLGGLGGLGAVLLDPVQRASERLWREGRVQLGQGGLAGLGGLGRLAWGGTLGAAFWPPRAAASALSWAADKLAAGAEGWGSRGRS
ncbi:MAG: C39 family peptidase [Candidatus Sericytochromatia bacterium]|nr:C39 family peptidase [Candidatus Sericytochromatia bacterium]